MRLRRLSLLRYGHLSDLVLEIPESAGLCVVHGENEAGKSTALAAIADALFGFGHRTAYDFLHPGPSLRIGVRLAATDGSERGFIRRKGRADTLQDEDGNALPEGAIQRFLGGASRDVFEHMFGLNGDRLREGGGALAQGGGAVGESLFAAGTGSFGLRAALERLDDEAKALFGGRGRRVVTDAVERWRQATRESEQRAVPPREWSDTEAHHASTRAELRRVLGAVDELQTEISRLQRVRRVTPLLVQIDAVRTRLSELGDVPALLADAEVQMRAALRAREVALADHAREAAASDRLQAESAALARDPAVLAVQDSIDRLAETRPIAVQAEADRPGVERDLYRLRAEIAEASAQVGIGGAPELKLQRLPSIAARQTVQALISRHGELTARAETARRDLSLATARLEAAQSALAASPPPPNPALLRATIEAVKQEGRPEAELAAASVRASSARQAADAALSALPLWQDDAAALEACKMPLPDAKSSAEAALAAADAMVMAARGERDRITTALAAIEARLLALSRGDTVPTIDAVRAARDERDGVWRTVRRALIEGLDHAGLPETYEKLLGAADRLADRRADEANRVADYMSATEQRAALSAALSDAAASLAAAEEQAQVAGQAWRSLWASAGLTPSTPAAMTQWVVARAEVLRLEGEARGQETHRDQLRQRRDVAAASLRPLVPPGDPAETLAELLRRAETACADIEAVRQASEQLQTTVAREAESLPALREAQTAAMEALARWREEWTPSMSGLGLHLDATIAEAEAALSAWSRIAETASALQLETHRVEAMTSCIEQFADSVRAVCAALGEPDDGEPAPVAAMRLLRRLAAARQVESTVLELERRIREHRDVAQEAEARRRMAENVLTELRGRAGVADDAALESALKRVAARVLALADEASLTQQIAAQGDGRTEAELRAEAAGIDPDQAAARIDAIIYELRALGDERERLSAEATRLDAALAAMRQGKDALDKAQEARQALAEAGTAAERYVRLHVARVLLRSGIERFRKTQQGPLLRAAGAHLAALTQGRYARLGVNEDDAGRPLLVAVAGDGSECPVEALSDGARDQLYLALRVAAIEAYAAGAEPLPFIADDLLVHFDDVRAEAAIKVLATLGRTTQVILFSHHAHIAELAAAQRSSDIAVLRFAAARSGGEASGRLLVA